AHLCGRERGSASLRYPGRPDDGLDRSGLAGHVLRGTEWKPTGGASQAVVADFLRLHFPRALSSGSIHTSGPAAAWGRGAAERMAEMGLSMTYWLAGLFLPLFPLSMGFNALLGRVRNGLLRAVLLLAWPQIGLSLAFSASNEIPDWVLVVALFTAALYAF